MLVQWTVKRSCFSLLTPWSDRIFFVGREKYKRPLEALFIRDKKTPAVRLGSSAKIRRTAAALLSIGHHENSSAVGSKTQITAGNQQPADVYQTLSPLCTTAADLELFAPFLL